MCHWALILVKCSSIRIPTRRRLDFDRSQPQPPSMPLGIPAGARSKSQVLGLQIEFRQLLRLGLSLQHLQDLILDVGVTVDGVTRLPATHGSAVSRHTDNLISRLFLGCVGVVIMLLGYRLFRSYRFRTYTTAIPRRLSSTFKPSFPF